MPPSSAALRRASNEFALSRRAREGCDAINRLDVRLEKMFRIANQGTTLGLFFDVFNVWNQGVHDSDVTAAVVDVSGPQFGQPNVWVDPRTLRLGVRVRF